ncbi:hypothetical protein KC722_00550 [Candidatus Kaiserbacteria bacterium]|nr:hypothetical protein [Candidatus Kaiserbacteria bacterium]MCB9811449.1 hypothetical protein [Candidatus Nomurabacteria bacterium]
MVRSFAKQHTNHSGLSLVEAIVYIAVFTILSLVVTNAIHSMYQYNAYTFAQAYQVQNARLGIQGLIRDIREMTFADDGSFPLVVMDSDRVGFYSDIDRDQSVEYVEYSYSDSTTFTKEVYNATGSPPVYNLSTPDETYTLSYYVQNNLQSTSTFMYYDADGNEVASSTGLIDVRYITAQLIINIDPIRDPGQYMLRSSAALRNVKDNL